MTDEQTHSVDPLDLSPRSETEPAGPPADDPGMLVEPHQPSEPDPGLENRIELGIDEGEVVRIPFTDPDD